jgi:hypothetical protein
MSIRVRPGRQLHHSLNDLGPHGKNIRRSRRYDPMYAKQICRSNDEDAMYEVEGPCRSSVVNCTYAGHQTHTSRAGLSYNQQQRGWVELNAGEGGSGESNFEALPDNVGLGLSTIPRESSETEDQPPSSGSRNNSLFFGSGISSDFPRPPPSRTMKKDAKLTPINTSAPIPETTSEDMRETHPSSLASRLRNIVAANRKTVVKTLPIPEHLRSDVSVSETSSPTSSNTSPTRNTTPSPSNSIDHKQREHSYISAFSSSSFSDDDSFLPLPSPAAAVTPSASTSTLNPSVHATKYITRSTTPSPTESEGQLGPSDSDLNIPILSASPSYTPRKKREIPSVLDFPLLGDSVYEDQDQPPKSHYASKSYLLDHQSKYHASPLGSKKEERMIGKTIWKFRIQKLLGVGAFSKVYLVECTETGKKYAIKMISKDRLAHDSRIRSSIDREVAILEVCIVHGFIKNNR